MAPWSQSRSKKKYQEPEPLGKKSGAGAAKKLAGSPALIKKIYFFYRIVSTVSNLACALQMLENKQESRLNFNQTKIDKKYFRPNNPLSHQYKYKL